MDYYYAVLHAEGFIGMMSFQDVIHWEMPSDYVPTPKELKMKDGRILKPDRLERPCVFLQNGHVTFLGLARKLRNESFVLTIPLK